MGATTSSPAAAASRSVLAAYIPSRKTIPQCRES
jgi:hypothetical protein